MGKRKFDNGNEKSSKKAKNSDCLSEENVDTGQPQNEEKSIIKLGVIHRNNGFDVKHFRKELKVKQGQTMALTQFLQVCLNPDSPADYLLEYLKCGGNSHEILRQINQESKKNLTLATPAFHIFHLIILKVQSSLPHMIAITEEACRYFLNTFTSTVEIMISENSGPRHRKIILKLLTSIVTLNSDLGVEVLSQAPLAPKHLQHIVEKPNFKEKDNVRTAFVHFMTSFLVDGHLPLIKALLEKQGLLGLVIPGLVSDDVEAVLMFLNILKKNVVHNGLISKSLKLKTFSHQVLHNLFKVFSWKGPPDINNDVRNESRPEIMGLLTDIISTLFTSHKLGLYFIDNSLGTADANKNQNLYKALLTLKRPWENEYECEVIMNIIYKCPDLHRAIINVIEQSFEPQHSPIWERSTEFIINLLNRLKPEEMVSRMSNLNPVQIANFVRFITLPVPLLKLININLRKDHTVSLYGIKVLVKMLQTLKRYIHILEMEDSSRVGDLKNKLEHFFPKHLPAPAIVVDLIQNVISINNIDEHTKDYRLPKISDTNALIILVDLLLLYNDIHPSYFETLERTIDMKQILDYSSTLSDGHISLLKFKIVSLWLKLDNSAISLKNPMFKDLFLIMLDVYMSDDDNTWIEAKDTMHIFFKNTCIFEGDEDEIHLILYALRNSKVEPSSLIGDIVEYVLENMKDLTDYVRNQLVHFEISSENSESSLKSLFSDLMENRTTEENMFMETKIPSPFIVGCIQYLQTHKDVKKNFKHFLSLYIANLLHSNYSPELTEVLIGEYKLDVRNYVASWISQPISLPDAISGRDEILKKISKSIIDHEAVSLKDVFPFLEETTKDSDVKINNVTYNIDFAKNIDSSELLIWSKYLIFCTVRLTNMGQLTEAHQKKITDYFQALITIARKSLLINVCRTIIVTLLKNPQLLKIYKPIDSKDGTDLLATNFILQVIDQHKDIVSYLINKHKILTLYQQKNYNEIVKAFIKVNKKKNLSCEHMIRVLEVIGLSNDDDMRVFNLIFGVDIDCCLKNDKEPSLVLELLRFLIEKYSKSITLELQSQILKKTMSLYTQLISNKDVNANLSNLEIALIQYFANKPHQTLRIVEDDFKKFFQANVVRKSTAALASVLLQFNVKFCNVFKVEIARNEVLTQRELTLPLGSAVINHKEFLFDNKDLLATIYSEYKSNIIKMLEKPHKAGQIYVSCWIFIKKLVLECMDLQDCEKLVNKTHKFETIELSHINIFHNMFLKICIAKGEIRKDHLVNYFSSMLHLLTIALKESKVEAVGNIVISLQRVIYVHGNMEKIDTKQDIFKKMTESAIWQNFCKAVLKDSLKVKTVEQDNTLGPKLLALLTNLVKLFYLENHEDIATLFDMVTSHSEFLNVMLSHHSLDIKSRLIELIYSLIVKNKSVMKVAHIPVYLSSYHATRSPCDRLILSILHHYEANGLPVNEYKPYVWGDSAANYYAVRKNRASSLWAHPTPNQVLNLFDRDVIERTVKEFPVTQKLDYHYELSPVTDINEMADSVKSVINEMFYDGVFKPNNVKDIEGGVNNLVLKGKYEHILSELMHVDVISTSHVDSDDRIYDPLFLFPLLSHLLAPGSVASCFKMLRIGLLSVPVMALSSRCPMMRAAAYHVLHRFCMLLETETRHKNDKLFLTDFITTLRHSLTTAINNVDNLTEDLKDLKNPKLPAVDALYFARALMVSTAPFDPLYKPVNNFFIAKQFVDLSLVPDFLSLFHDCDVESIDRRLWVLDIIKDGTKTMIDINVLFKTMCLKMIMDFYSSVLSDRKVKVGILNVLSSVISIPRAFEILVEGHGLLSWLHLVVRNINDGVLLKCVFNLVRNMMYSMIVGSFARNIAAKNGKVNDYIELRINKDIEQEILLIVYDLLKHIDDVEDVLEYVKIYKLMSKKTIKSISKKQMLGLVNKIGVFYKDCEVIRLIIKSLLSNDNVVLKSLNMNESFQCASKQSIVNDLVDVVTAYIN